jgi:adenylate kinase
VILLLFGPPGCGKGTQASFLVDRLRIPSISTGEMFRAEIKAETPLGKRASAILAQGGLVGDPIVNAMVANRIEQDDCRAGFLLDGYPRTVAQAKFFAMLLEKRGLPQPTVIHIDVPSSDLVARLTARRQCPKCKHIYNLLTNPPQSEGRCDDCGEKLIQRDDDCETAIRQRLQAYEEQTGPVLGWFGPDRVLKVDGRRKPADVSAAIDRALLKKMVEAPAEV